MPAQARLTACSTLPSIPKSADVRPRNLRKRSPKLFPGHRLPQGCHRPCSAVSGLGVLSICPSLKDGDKAEAEEAEGASRQKEKAKSETRQWTQDRRELVKLPWLITVCAWHGMRTFQNTAG